MQAFPFLWTKETAPSVAPMGLSSLIPLGQPCSDLCLHLSLPALSPGVSGPQIALWAPDTHAST